MQSNWQKLNSALIEFNCRISRFIVGSAIVLDCCCSCGEINLMDGDHDRSCVFLSGLVYC